MLLMILVSLMIIIGMFFILTSFIGLIRFKDFNSKIHASSIIETLGIGLIMLAIALLQPNFLNSLKILLMIILLWLLAPVSTHLIAKAYYVKEKK